LTPAEASTNVDDVTSGTLHTLAGDADSDDPIVALRAIATLHRELDRLEAVAVRRARNANATWQLIALALGVSKQAVHKKYGRK
jgi:DNA invertase Pin-like site-specific DNA recombinase